MMALSAGENKITLTLEEADNTLEAIRLLNEKIVKYMEYVPEDVLKAEAEELFGGEERS
jgi:hypothetical protein